MTLSKIPPKVLEAASTALSERKESGVFRPANDYMHEWDECNQVWWTAVEWLWSHLSEQAPEFDEMAAENAAIQQANICIDEYKSGKSLWAICELAFRNGASWQFDQMKVREAALLASGQELTDIYMDLEQKHYLLTIERDDLRAELKAVRHEMRMQGGAVERINATLAEVARRYPIAYVTSESSYRAMAKRWSDEVERLELQLSIYTEAENNFSKLKHAYRIERERAAKLLQSGQALVNWAEANHEMPGYSQVISEMREAIAEYKGDKA